MPAMLMPAINSYFAIYTLEGAGKAGPVRTRGGMNWDLHATATDRTLAISHARMLALQPNVREVHVKQVVEDLTSGLVSVKDVKRCKRGDAARMLTRAGCALGLAAIMAGFIFLL